MSTLEQKLNPARFPGMSGKMAAIVGLLLNKEFTTPALTELVTTSDGYVLGRLAGDVGHNDFIGTRGELVRNLKGLADAAGLTAEEYEEFRRAAAQRLGVSLNEQGERTPR